METRVGGKNDYIWHLSVFPHLGAVGIRMSRTLTSHLPVSLTALR